MFNVIMGEIFKREEGVMFVFTMNNEQSDWSAGNHLSQLSALSSTQSGYSSPVQS